MSKPGPKTELTKELFKKIKESILEGNDLTKTANVCEIDRQKLYNWHCDNYLNIRDRIAVWRLEGKLKRAEGRSDEILSLSVTDAEGKVDSSVASIVQKESQFIRKTLGKDNYSERTELTGKDGEAIRISKEEEALTEDTINEFLNVKNNTGDITGGQSELEESIIPVQ